MAESMVVPEGGELKLLLLTVNQIGDQMIGLPRPVICCLQAGGDGTGSVREQTCQVDPRFRQTVADVWQLLRRLLPGETAGLSLEVTVRGRGTVTGGSVGLPLTINLLAALLGSELPASVYGTGLMALPDGWFAGQHLEEMQAKAAVLTSLAGRGGEPTLVIPFHRQVPLPDPVPGVRYLGVANVAAAARALLPDRADEVGERFRAISTIEQLPFPAAVQEAYQASEAETVVLNRTSFEPGPLTIEIIDEAWGPVVWVHYPGLPGGGTMVYRFAGDQLLDKEHFGSPQELREHGDLLTGPPEVTQHD